MTEWLYIPILLITLSNNNVMGNFELGVVGILLAIISALLVRYEWWGKRWMKSVESNRAFDLEQYENKRSDDNIKTNELYDKLARALEKLNETITNHNLSLVTLGNDLKTIKEMARGAANEANQNTNNLIDFNLKFVQFQTHITDYIDEMRKERMSTSEILKDQWGKIRETEKNVSNIMKAHKRFHKEDLE
jgi:hypothetical protein